jgi:phage terminase small subunit
MKEELNEKQKMFCLEYLKTFNATASYKKVYWWTDNTARVNSSRLLANANIQEFLWSKVEKKIEKFDVWVDYVLDNLHQIVEIWMWRQPVNLNWQEKEVMDLKNVNSALEKLWKYHKMYTEKIEQEWNLSINIVSYKTWQN